MREMNTMTVGQLMQVLENFDSEVKVGIAYKSGDYWNTVLVAELSDYNIDYGDIEWSGYHNTWRVIGEESDVPVQEEVLLLGTMKMV